jgi:hypothetical protein
MPGELIIINHCQDSWSRNHRRAKVFSYDLKCVSPKTLSDDKEVDLNGLHGMESTIGRK